jgi:hypothetical protein
MAGEIDRAELGIGDLDAFGVFVAVQLGPHFEASVGGRRGNQLDDRAIGAKRFTSPVYGDGRDRGTARATLGKGLAVSAFPLYVPV